MPGIFEVLAERISSVTSRQRSLIFKILSLIGGGMIFLMVFPFLLGAISKTILGAIPEGAPLFVRYIIGIPCIAVGLGILIWAVKAFWSSGGGTPSPIAAPQLLVTTGPYRYCRNPIQLGAMILYFGMGAVADSIIAGTGMCGLALILGTLYHSCIEEKELQRRFGEQYLQYRKRTPFLIPRFNLRAADKDSASPQC